MPEHTNTAPARTISDLSERVIVVEMKVTAALESISVIRTMMHEINNDLTKGLGLAMHREELLNQLLSLTRDLPTIAASSASFMEMKTRIMDVLDDRQHRKGQRSAVMLMGTLLAGSVTIGGAITGAVVWLLGLMHR